MPLSQTALNRRLDQLDDWKNDLERIEESMLKNSQEPLGQHLSDIITEIEFQKTHLVQQNGPVVIMRGKRCR